MRSLFLLSLGVASLGKASGDSLLSWLSALAPESHEGAVESHVFQEWDVNDEEESNVISNLSEELPLTDLDVDEEQRARGLKRRHRVLSPSSPSGKGAPAKAPSQKKTKKKAKGPAAPSAPNAPSAPGSKKKKTKKQAPAPSGPAPSGPRRRH